MMRVGTLRLRLRIESAQSLKEKRAVVQGIVGRLRARLHVSVAEVDDQEHWNVATLGVACVTRDGATLSRALDAAEALVAAAVDAELIEVERDLL